jgi:hypothetical protein
VQSIRWDAVLLTVPAGSIGGEHLAGNLGSLKEMAEEIRSRGRSRETALRLDGALSRHHEAPLLATACRALQKPWSPGIALPRLREKQWRNGAQHPDSHPLPGSAGARNGARSPHRFQPIPADLDLAKTA